MKIKLRQFCLFRRPGHIRVPLVGPALENIRLPRRFLAYSVQVVAEKRRLYRLAKLARRFVSPERNESNRFTLWGLPLPVKPRSRNHEIVVVRVVLSRVLDNLPRSPGI